MGTYHAACRPSAMKSSVKVILRSCAEAASGASTTATTAIRLFLLMVPPRKSSFHLTAKTGTDHVFRRPRIRRRKTWSVPVFSLPFSVGDDGQQEVGIPAPTHVQRVHAAVVVAAVMRVRRAAEAIARLDVES